MECEAGLEGLASFFNKLFKKKQKAIHCPSAPDPREYPFFG